MDLARQKWWEYYKSGSVSHFTGSERQGQIPSPKPTLYKCAFQQQRLNPAHNLHRARKALLVARAPRLQDEAELLARRLLHQHPAPRFALVEERL